MNTVTKAIIIAIAIATSACNTAQQTRAIYAQSDAYQTMQDKAQQARQAEATIQGIIKQNLTPVSMQGGDAFNTYNTF